MQTVKNSNVGGDVSGCSSGTIETAILLSLQRGCIGYNISVLVHPSGLPIEFYYNQCISIKSCTIMPISCITGKLERKK